jgi:hypothetical protein
MDPNRARPSWRTAIAIALILTPLFLAGAKQFHGPQWLALGTSLEPLPRHARRHVEYLMFVPLSTMIVAFFRLTLGFKVLSVFRPVLIAIAFQRTGIPLGMAFLTLALATVVVLQPALKGRSYYARVPMTAVIVVAMMVTSLIAYQHWHAGWMMHVAYFPVIALCLTCESFASALARSGVAKALWRAVTTTAIGILVMTAGSIPGFMALLVRCPELLLAEAGCVLLIAERFDFRLFESFNPLSALWQEPPSAKLPAGAQVELVETNQ